MDTLKPPRQLIIGIMFSILLSGCASVDQFLNQGETSAQILQLQIEQQNQQIGLLVEQQNTILAELQKQPALFVLQQQNIAQLANKLEDYVQLRQQVISNSQLIASYQPDKPTNNIEHLPLIQSTEAIAPIDKLIIGSEELILLSNLQEKYKARIDTGATTSSLNATDIVEFERDGIKWVRFNFSQAINNETQIIEAKVARTILIRQANNSEPTRRPIIELPVQLGDMKMLTEFTLADRSHMTFPVLLGRTFLKDIVMVDVARTYTITESAIP
ncbi:MAG: ATP-dependent zinc protease [Moritella sp.]|uniref:ATP-dependent zinc protease family protein n=2 Tax=unclassified Moritella TaxID=2637987 RepID=UPI0005C49EB5|nr:ATP-dependent zinc protease [Moritella sp. PE36]MBL1416567.1 ATP-dependent zinc protease [Moritella sp.]